MVDTYSSFIEEISVAAYECLKIAKIMTRFLSGKAFAEYMTMGAHTFIMKRLYRNLFDKMGQSERDKNVCNFFRDQAGKLYQKNAEAKLMECLRMKPHDFERLIGLSKQA